MVLYVFLGRGGGVGNAAAPMSLTELMEVIFKLFDSPQPHVLPQPLTGQGITKALPYLPVIDLQSTDLNQQLLNGVLQLLDLVLQLRAFVGRDRAGDNGARHAARAAECLLVRHKHVRDVLRTSRAHV